METIEMPAQEVDTLEELTNINDDAVVQAAREHVRVVTPRELRALSLALENRESECGQSPRGVHHV